MDAIWAELRSKQAQLLQDELRESVADVPAHQRCRVCRAALHKYTCPACFSKSCSVECIKRHKQDTGCSGMRSRVRFIPASKYDINSLIDDSAFLQQVARAKDVAKRGQVASIGHKIGKKQHTLAKRASECGVNLTFMPRGMRRATINKSFFNQKYGVLIQIECCCLDR